MLGVRLITAACSHSYHPKSPRAGCPLPSVPLHLDYCRRECRVPMPFISFIEPALPMLHASPPAGDGWLHEIKFDGWRVQLCKLPSNVSIYSKSGRDFGRKFLGLVDALLRCPCAPVLELTA
jgi:ATP-dependent DNA ligase